MAQLSGLKLVSIAGGGAADNGQTVYATLRITDGKNNSTVNLLIDHERLPLELLALMDCGAIAREERLKRNPQGEDAGTVTGSFAFPTPKALGGQSLSDDSKYIVVMQVDPGHGRLVNVAFALDEGGLKSLFDVAREGLREIRQSTQAKAKKKQLN